MASKIKMFNHRTKEYFIIDTLEMRHKRKRQKITAWMKYHQDEVNLGKQRNKPYDALFVTLTYSSMDLFNPGQIRSYIKLIKERIKTKLIAYAWVCEMQKRGVPHYHIIFIVKKGTKIRKPDQGDWKYGFSNIQKAYKGLYYIISYLKKVYDTEIPKNARVFGIFARGILKKYIRLDCLPIWLKNFIHENGVKFTSENEFKKVTGGWLINDEVIWSPYKPVMNTVTGNIQTF